MSEYEKFKNEGHKAALSSIVLIPVCIILMFVFVSSPAALGGIMHDSSVQAEAGPLPGKLEYEDIPEQVENKPYTEVHGNKPYFSKKQLKNRKIYEHYGKLDKLGRCTRAESCIGKSLMPTKARGEIGIVKPSGWHTVKYAGIDGNYLYNRCHLIGYQLTGENANKKNLITGTRFLNVKGMLPFENMVAEYLRENQENHVLYRVTPVFKGKDLLARGVLMEAQSIEDKGQGVKFCVFCYNTQPGISIDYRNGSSKGSEYTGSSTARHDKTDANEKKQKYVLNTSSKKFHLPGCDAVKTMKSHNKRIVRTKRSNLIRQGYEPCGWCKA